MITRLEVHGFKVGQFGGSTMSKTQAVSVPVPSATSSISLSPPLLALLPWLPGVWYASERKAPFLFCLLSWSLGPTPATSFSLVFYLERLES